MFLWKITELGIDGVSLLTNIRMTTTTYNFKLAAKNPLSLGGLIHR